MKLKKILTTLIAIMVTTSITTIPASASTQDNYFSFYVGWNYSDAGITSAHDKEDASYTYMYNQSTMDLWVRAWGYTPTGPDGSMQWTIQTKNFYAIVPVGEYFITQYVYENGGRSEYLEITKATKSTLFDQANGLWSPDSVGSYPIAN